MRLDELIVDFSHRSDDMIAPFGWKSPGLHSKNVTEEIVVEELESHTHTSVNIKSLGEESGKNILMKY